MDSTQLGHKLALHAKWVESNGKAGAQLALEDADLCGLELANVILSKAQLPGARFEGAKLQKAQLEGANVASIDASLPLSIRRSALA